MIISQTPFRVSFAGGGTDLPAFYREEYGAVLSTTLKRYMYVTVHRRFENSVRVSYSRTEIADDARSVQHDLVREAMLLTGVEAPLEVTTVADTPSGTGLGSSSTLTVGLLNALSAYSGRVAAPESLAAGACQIEIETLGHPIGKQDQYAAAYGGLNLLQFEPDGRVSVNPVPWTSEYRSELEASSLLVYTAATRSASQILREQSAGTPAKRGVLRRMRDLTADMVQAVIRRDDVGAFGTLLHEGWELKRSLGFGISNSKIDDWYAMARRHGAWGGKLLGAGGGGFLLVVAPPEAHDGILKALGEPQVMPIEFEPRGSRIVFISE